MIFVFFFVVDLKAFHAFEPSKIISIQQLNIRQIVHLFSFKLLCPYQFMALYSSFHLAFMFNIIWFSKTISTGILSTLGDPHKDLLINHLVCRAKDNKRILNTNSTCSRNNCVMYFTIPHSKMYF